jgi:hypothetical protein
MTRTEPAWTTCHSRTLPEEASLSCAECCALEYRKCDGCPASAFAIWADESKDPLKSIKISRWIDALAPYVRGTAAVAA